MTNVASRNYGLDLVRSVATLFILVAHSRHFFVSYNIGFDWEYINLLSFMGIELFFVLSGFLIGKILLKTVWNINITPFKDKLRIFLIRRWFRTLPLYYLLLIINIIVYFVGTHFNFVKVLHVFPSYLLFLQNFVYPQKLPFFLESWSLVIEEWFYLTIPLAFSLILMLIHKLNYKNRKRTGQNIFKYLTFFLAFIIIIATVSRFLFKYTDSVSGLLVFFRFDTFAIGILFAAIEKYYNNFSLKFVKNKIINTMAFIGITFFSWMFLKAMPLKSNCLSNCIIVSLGYLLNSFCLGIIIFSLYFNYNINLKLFEYISKISYSLYLTNHLFLTIILFTLKVENNIILSTLICISFLIICFGTSTLLYKYYEVPLMNLREKFKLKNSNKEKTDLPNLIPEKIVT